MKSYTHAQYTEDFHSPRPCRSGGCGKGAGRGVLGAGPTPQERAKVLGPAKGPRPQPTPAGWPEKQLPGRCAAPGLGAGNGPGGRPRRGPAPPRCREGSRPAAGGVGEGRPGLRPVGGVQPGPRVRLSAGPPALGSEAPRRDSPERPGSASWCPSGCPCLCSDSTWCSSPPRRRLRVTLRGAGVTFKAGGQARGYAGGGGSAAPGLGWGAGRPLGGRGGGGGGSGSGGSGSAGGCAGAAAPRGPPHARLGSLYRAPPRWRRRRRRTNISLRRPNVLLLLLLLRLSETRSGPEGGGGRREGGEPESGEIGGRGVGGREGEAGGRGGDAQISREEGERGAPSGAGRSLGAGGVNRRGGGEWGVGEVGGTSGAGSWKRGGAEGGRRKLPF